MYVIQIPKVTFKVGLRIAEMKKNEKYQQFLKLKDPSLLSTDKIMLGKHIYSASFDTSP